MMYGYYSSRGIGICAFWLGSYIDWTECSGICISGDEEVPS